MEKQSVNLPDLNIVSQDELQQEYKTLFRKYKELLHEQEESSQAIHDLKRSLQTAIATESYLNQELDLVVSNQSSEIIKINKIHSAEIEQWKQKYADLADVNASQEKFSDKLKKDNYCLKQRLQELESRREHELGKPSTYAESDADFEHMNLEQLSKIDDLQFQLNEYILITADKEKTIDYMREKVHCLEESLQAKREEISEKDALLESLQERLAELNTELASLKTQPECPSRKGNSLFAEVDDQRQAMRNMLALQKRQYLQMKSCYNESKNEIKRLKRENAAMQEELRACSSLFLHAERTYKDKLHERIIQLIHENEKLEKKLRWTEDKVIAVGKEKAVKWIDSMFAFCRNETEGLKTELRKCLFEKCSLEHNLMESQQQEAKWRFEALRSRCIIIDREYLLDEHGIKFKKANEIHCTVTAEDCEKATPWITSEGHRNSTKSPDETQFAKSKKLSKSATFKYPNNIFDGLLKKPLITQTALNLKPEIDVCNDEYLNTSEFNEISGNSVKVKEDNEASQVCCIGEIKKEKTEKSPFEIFEDEGERSSDAEFANELVQSLGKQITSDSDISVPEDALQKMTDIEHVNRAGRTSPVFSKNSADFQKSEFSHATSCFQVYEDTTQHLPLVKVRLKRDERLKYSNDLDKENQPEGAPNLSSNELSILQGSDSNIDCPKKESNFERVKFTTEIEHKTINIKGSEGQSLEKSEITITRITIG